MFFIGTFEARVITNTNLTPGQNVKISRCEIYTLMVHSHKVPEVVISWWICARDKVVA